MKLKILLLTVSMCSIFLVPSYASGWEQHNDAWKYSQDGDYLKNTWHQDTDGNWYYFGGNAKMLTGLQTIADKRYFFSPSGAMQTGWVMLDGWYHFDQDGAGSNDWIQDRKDWYFFTNGKALKSQWKEIDGTNYYFSSYGKMAANTYVGKYFIGADGVIDSRRTLTDYSSKTLTSVMEKLPDNLRNRFFNSGGYLRYDSSNEVLTTYSLISEDVESGAKLLGNYIVFHDPESLYYAFAEYSDKVTNASQDSLFVSWIEDETIPDLLGIDTEGKSIYSSLRKNMYTVLAETIINPDKEFPGDDDYAFVEQFIRDVIYAIPEKK